MGKDKLPYCHQEDEQEHAAEPARGWKSTTLRCIQSVRIVLLLLAIFILVIRLANRTMRGPTESGPDWRLEVQEPRYNVSDMAHMATSDLRVLAGFQGHLRYFEPASFGATYLPLHLEGVEHEIETAYKSARSVVVLHYRRPLSMRLAFGARTSRARLLRLQEVSVRTGHQSMSCLTADMGIHLSLKRHYICEKPMKFLCSRQYPHEDGPRPVAELSINAIHLELDGQPQDHELGQITHPAHVCPF